MVMKEIVVSRLSIRLTAITTHKVEALLF